MNIIQPDVKLIEQGNDLTAIYKHIELCGRTCYQSLDKITDDSYNRFIKMLEDNKHGSVLEHGTVYLYFSSKKDSYCTDTLKYRKNPYTRTVDIPGFGSYVTTNYRVICENGWFNDLECIVPRTSNHIRRYTFKITTGIDITREANRHRVNSVSEESTRYCNYSKNKFGNAISIIANCDCPKEVIENKLAVLDALNYSVDKAVDPLEVWIMANQYAEECYFKLIELGWKPQQARRVLPLDTKTEVIYTAFKDDWEHFITLRANPSAHPDIQAIANVIKHYIEE